MKDATDITIVLDRSGSMSSIQSDTIGGFNTFIAEQKAIPGDCAVTLIQFDSQNPQEIIFNAVPIADVPALTAATFTPRASTPLYDAMGQAIVSAGIRFAAMPEDQRPGKVLFIVITDGEENSSHEYSREKVFALVAEQKKTYGWTFVYIGANQDAMKTGPSVGVHVNAAMTYTAAGPQTRSVYTSLSANVGNTRRGPQAAAASNMSWTDDQRRKAGTPSGRPTGKR
jgi:hypothetical protein